MTFAVFLGGAGLLAGILLGSLWERRAPLDPEFRFHTGRPEKLPTDEAAAVQIDYVNWRGEHTPDRLVVPRRLYWGCNLWHPEQQWLLDAFDVAKGAERTFAVKAIRGWTPAAIDYHIRTCT